jgi:hypothetical protein
MPHSNLGALRLFIAVEWDKLVAVYIAKHAAHSTTAKKPPLRKIMFELNRWLANSPTHIIKYFSGLEEVSKRH